MQIFTDPRAMQEFCQQLRCKGDDLGFVPTMGALHAGHLELCRRAREENRKVVASVFVNPTQFSPGEDMERYPRPLEADLQALRDVGCDAVFTPDTTAMYGDTDALHNTWVDVAPFAEMWEGVTRPGHLRGVATVVTKLFNIVYPSRAYFGEKDFQQLRVVEELTRDLNFPIQIVGVETVREADGLALSSRNAYLSAAERKAASAIPQALRAGVEAARAGETDVAQLGRIIGAVLESQPLIEPQYVAVVDAKTLAALQHLDGKAARILITAFVGKTRLIDNMAL
jgi:pantoate--beta-alanine ligase